MVGAYLCNGVIFKKRVMVLIAASLKCILRVRAYGQRGIVVNIQLTDKVEYNRTHMMWKQLLFLEKSCWGDVC